MRTLVILLALLVATAASAQVSLPGCDVVAPTGQCDDGDHITFTDQENMRLFVNDAEARVTAIEGDLACTELQVVGGNAAGDGIECQADNTTPTADAVDDTMIDWGSGANQVNASDVPSTPSGGIAATTVEGAIDELDTEKVNASAVGNWNHSANAPVDGTDTCTAGEDLWLKTSNPFGIYGCVATDDWELL